MGPDRRLVFCFQWICKHTWVTISSAVMCTDDILAVGCLGAINTKVVANAFCSVSLATTAVFAVFQKPSVHRELCSSLN